MVVDILDDPATLLDYIEVRSLVASLGVEVIMESDALEGYLLDRLGAITEDARSADDHTTVVFGYGSAAINGYFTAIEMGVEYEKPTRGIPAPVLRALTATYDATTRWSHAARAIVAAELGVWKAWRKFNRKHKTPRPFVLPGTDVALISRLDVASAHLDGPTFVLPIDE
jgi:hypothetical protein